MRNSVVYWKKSFPFSASFPTGDKIYGFNYHLQVTIIMDRFFSESQIIETIERDIISKVHSKDLSLHVSLFAGKTVCDKTILEVFSVVLRKALKKNKLVALQLDRDSRTSTEMVF